jgi:hypothetical protein
MGKLTNEQVIASLEARAAHWERVARDNPDVAPEIFWGRRCEANRSTDLNCSTTCDKAAPFCPAFASKRPAASRMDSRSWLQKRVFVALRKRPRIRRSCLRFKGRVGGARQIIPTLGERLPRRGFAREISKLNTKSPMHKKCSKSFSRPRFGGRAAMHTEMAPTSSRAQGKGEPNVAASDAKCVTGTGTRSFTAAIGGTADMNGRVASANSVEFDPKAT